MEVIPYHTAKNFHWPIDKDAPHVFYYHKETDDICIYMHDTHTRVCFPAAPRRPFDERDDLDLACATCYRPLTFVSTSSGRIRSIACVKCDHFFYKDTNLSRL